MKGIAAIIAVLTAMLLNGCGQPVGKADLKSDPKLRAEILAACADGTHTNAQECSNAKDVENADKLERSLGHK
ncbi:EexN family lipoprotein [Sphingobium limneticum]|uniref:EexN family lipoprotein n=1 Tax=Sphingobium limneticum TaxID=1007511 RepID=A0A5J5HU39_9SPHN|nr:EexN family lipoprotein [Sphingobium limneticum]KAA9013101.1 EexN family lipoprotein [Sphingobium limneticum]KAA9025399.1 EexN family lipoprotein [Sphingobium limneticum]